MGAVLLAVLAVGGIWATSGADPDDLIPPAGKYDVRILRDTWGVPHIFGKTDADCAYGLAYANAEDDYATILEALRGTRGKMAATNGKESAPQDYVVGLLRIRETVAEKYESDLSVEVRATCEAYAAGLNHYAALHPEEKAGRDLLPFTAQDVVAGFVFKVPFFFGLDNKLEELFGEERRRPVAEKKAALRGSGVPAASLAASGAEGTRRGRRVYDSLLTGDLPIGSNAFAVSPLRSSDGQTFLNINSHQPWEGVVAWYEAHLHSEEGLDIVGGTFPGAPVILVGHNRHLGWAHTVNRADLADVYVLDINPENPNQYKFDGAWRDLEVRQVPITVKIWGPIRWTVKREALWSVYGPAVRRPHGVYAIRYASQGDIRQVEQWYRMGKASNLAEWQAAMRMGSIASFNCIYGDEKGNIYYLFNALLPLRNEAYDWEQYLPGDTSETLWTKYLPVEQLPQVLNPASGFIQSCNSTPFKTTTGPGNPDPVAFSPSFGLDSRITNRARRALALFDADNSITEEEFVAYKYDMRYADDGPVAEKIRAIVSAPPSDDPLVREAVDIVRAWDFNTNPENTSAALAVLTAGPDPDGEAAGDPFESVMARLGENARAIKEAHGRLDVPWGEVNRLYRGDLNIPIGGAPDVLHAVYGFRVRKGKVEGLENGQMHGRAGDCYVLIAVWDKQGKLHSRSIHQFGSASTRPESPHYADQAPLFAAREMKPVWLDESEIRAHLEREYRPGE
jgi:penicillin amidase/acyl-homoserine-lactone acylase